MNIETTLTASVVGPSERHRALAKELEFSFLTEMMKHTGLEESGTFGGGLGAEQFASIGTRIRVESIFARSSTGIAEMIINSMSRNEAENA